MPNSVGGDFTVLTWTPEIAYRFPRKISLQLRAPIHRKTFDETTPDIHVAKTGLGDMELLGSYDVLPWRESQSPPRWRLTVGVGLTLPTGAHEEQPLVGGPIPTPLQLGSGTVDPLFALSGQYRASEAWSIDAYVVSRFPVMENADAYRPASVIELGTGGEGRPWPERLGLGLHLEWSHLTKVAIDGIEVQNTGRDGIYVVPSVNVEIWGGLALGVNARVPVYLNVNETQFAEDFLLAARLIYRTPPLF